MNMFQTFMYLSKGNHKVSQTIQVKNFSKLPTLESPDAAESQFKAELSPSYHMRFAHSLSLTFSQWVHLPHFPVWRVFAVVPNVRDLLGMLKPHAVFLTKLVVQFAQVDNGVPVALASKNSRFTSALSGVG